MPLARCPEGILFEVTNNFQKSENFVEVSSTDQNEFIKQYVENMLRQFIIRQGILFDKLR